MPRSVTWWFCWSIAIVAVVEYAARAAEPPKPRIVFVLADDLGPGDLGCWGGNIAPTPRIDRMAREGIRFTRYYAASPICSPSRCGLITGQFPARWRITSFLQTRAGNHGCQMADFLDPRAPSLPRLLKNAGYKTAHFGKWHLGGGRDVIKPPPFSAYGYDEHAGTWESPQPHPDITATNWVWSERDKVKRWHRSAFFVDKTLDFLRRNANQPCFVNLWLDDPHTPWVPDSNKGKADSPRENLRAVMMANDREIGRLLDGLESLGLTQRTLVIFASDNGPLPTLQGARSAGLRGSKLSLYEGGIRVPLIARWPNTVPAGRVDNETVISAVDFLPTLCRFAGVSIPPDVSSDGEDQSPALLGTPQFQRKRPLFWEYGRNEKFFVYPTLQNGARPNDRSPNVAVRDGAWKLLVHADNFQVELFHLLDDPGETRNRVRTEPAQAARLVKMALDWRSSLP